jgi:gliding motility-associated-like protein
MGYKVIRIDRQRIIVQQLINGPMEKLLPALCLSAFLLIFSSGFAQVDHSALVNYESPNKDCFENNLHAANVFSPNGDGRNDYFLPYCLRTDNLEFKLVVYNLIGILVFETNDPYRPWNGSSLNSGTANTGSYVWIAKVTDQQGGKHQFSGKIALLR